MKKLLFITAILLLGPWKPAYATWDTTTPTGSESKSLGDDRIRELKTDIQSALQAEGVFPGTDTAHPKYFNVISSGTSSGRPTNPSVGRWYVNYSSACIEQYNGSSWNCIMLISTHGHTSATDGGQLSTLDVTTRISVGASTITTAGIVASSVSAGVLLSTGTTNFYISLTSSAVVLTNGANVPYYTVAYDNLSELTIQSSTITFTAKKTGTYRLKAAVITDYVAPNCNPSILAIVTTARTYSGPRASSFSGQNLWEQDVIAKMTAGDTARITFTLGGSCGSGTPVVYGSSGGFGTPYFEGQWQP